MIRGSKKSVTLLMTIKKFNEILSGLIYTRKVADFETARAAVQKLKIGTTVIVSNGAEAEFLGMERDSVVLCETKTEKRKRELLGLAIIDQGSVTLPLDDIRACRKTRFVK